MLLAWLGLAGLILSHFRRPRATTYAALQVMLIAAVGSIAAFAAIDGLVLGKWSSARVGLLVGGSAGVIYSAWACRQMPWGYRSWRHSERNAPPETALLELRSLIKRAVSADPLTDGRVLELRQGPGRWRALLTDDFVLYVHGKGKNVRVLPRDYLEYRIVPSARGRGRGAIVFLQEDGTEGMPWEVTSDAVEILQGYKPCAPADKGKH